MAQVHKRWIEWFEGKWRNAGEEITKADELQALLLQIEPGEYVSPLVRTAWIDYQEFHGLKDEDELNDWFN